MNLIRIFTGTLLCLAIAGGSTVFAREQQSNTISAPAVSTGTPAVDTRTNLEKLSDPNPYVRRNAAILVGNEKKKENVPALLQLLGDPNPEVRRAAINGLAATGDKRAVAPLVNGFKTEQNLSVKMNIIAALGDLKGAGSLPLLKSLLKDPYPVYRSEALRSLGKINAPDTQEAMVAMLKDEAEGVRAMAADTVAELKLRSAAPLLVQNLKDPVVAVRRTAAHALGVVGTSTVLPDLQGALSDPDAGVAAAAKEAITQIEKRVAEQPKPAAAPQHKSSGNK